MMKKQIVISLCCSCLLYAGWYEDAKAKADAIYNSTKTAVSEKTDAVYNSTKTVVKEKTEQTKESYEKYNKEREEAKQKELDVCIEGIKRDLPRYALLLEKHYMNVNSRGEHKILNSYKGLNTKGISPDLKASVDPVLIDKLTHSKSTLEYSSSVISALKEVQKELKKNEQEKLNSLIKQVQFLMFAWTAPMEISSTHNIYNASLLGINEELYKNINKSNYANYTRFIYSLLYVNLVNENIVIKKDTAVEGAGKSILAWHSYGLSLGLSELPTSEDKKGIETICKDLLGSTFKKAPQEIILENFSTTLDIRGEVITKDLEEISKNNNLFDKPLMFSQEVTDLKEVSIIDNPLNDSWYLMIREYMELQDDFYRMKEEVLKIIKILDVLPDTENKIATLKQNLFEVDALYRKFDEVVRYNIIDLPVSIYADLYYLEFQKGKKWYDDDEKAMGDIAVAYNKACANMQKYMVSEYSIGKVMRITKSLKSEFDEETEWKEVMTRAKLTQDWFNMLNKVEIKNK